MDEKNFKGEAVTWGLKTDENFRQEIKDVIDNSGKTANEFMKGLLNLYKVEKMKQTSQLVHEDLHELQILTQRINSIFLNLSERTNMAVRIKEEEMQKDLDAKDVEIKNKNEEISNLLSSIELMKIENQETKSEKQLLINQINDLETKLTQVNKANQVNEALINEYKDKNDNLNGLLIEYKGFKSENGTLKAAINEMQLEKKELEVVIKDNEKDLESLKARQVETLKSVKSELELVRRQELMEQKEKFRSIQDAEKEKYQETIEKLQSVQNAEREKHQGIIEKLQQNLTNIQEEYSSKISYYMQETQDIQTKNRELIEALEKSNKPQKQESKINTQSAKK
jgi:predicted  nucleic acid-binding Zn-ribbon protein